MKRMVSVSLEIAEVGRARNPIKRNKVLESERAKMKKRVLVTLIIIFVICISLCACEKNGKKLTTTNWDDYLYVDVSYTSASECQKGSTYITRDGFIFVTLSKSCDKQIEIESVSVEVTLSHPWSFGNSSSKTVSLIGDGNAWYSGTLECSAKSILINTWIDSLSRSDISVRVKNIVGTVK